MIKVINKDIGQNFYRQKCDNCAAELEFSFDDTYEGWLGARYIKCPVCGEEVMAEEIEAKALYSSNIEFPKHFRKINKVVDIDDKEIQKWVKQCLKTAEESNEPYGYFVSTGSGNTQVILMAYADEYDIVVAKDYYEATVFRY